MAPLLSIAVIRNTQLEIARELLMVRDNLDAVKGKGSPSVGVGATRPHLSILPAELTDANAFVALHHRHHKPVTGHRWSAEVVDETGATRGVAIVGRPMARMTDQRRIVEAIRVAKDGCDNACSALYGAVCRQQRAHGYQKAITFILASEPGTSLRAAGWRPVAISAGGTWSRPSRHRENDHPLEPKVRWECACSELPAITLEMSTHLKGDSHGSTR